MAEVNESAVEQALESAFNPAPERVAKESARPAEPDEPAEAPEPVEAAPEAEEDGEPAPVASDPEFEIVVDGVPEIVKGADQIKELLQKGRDYSKKSEVIARARDALQAQFQQHQASAQFQQAVLGDVSELRAIDARLEEYSRVDWAGLFESDPFKGLQLKEQRDQLREARSAKLQELNGKHQHFQSSQAEAAQRMLAAESAALFAKLPEWRNSDTRTKEQQQVRSNLEQYGFNAAEIDGVMDHRMLLVARDAAKWRALQSGKAQKIGQVQANSPVIKPGAPVDKGKVATNNDAKSLRAAVKSNDTRGQEEAVVRLLNRAFK